MSGKERSLPKPPTKAFGRERRFEEDDGRMPLMADQMAEAAASGRLEEFLRQEIPDNEYARRLAMMMMGMSGMMHPGGSPLSRSDEPVACSELKGGEPVSGGEMSPAPEPPEDVLKAIQKGDVKEVMDLLAREHKQRSSDPSVVDEKSDALPSGLSPLEKDTLGRLMGIASENGLTMDWIVMRALRLYVEEYRKTGRL